MQLSPVPGFRPCLSRQGAQAAPAPGTPPQGSVSVSVDSSCQGTLTPPRCWPPAGALSALWVGGQAVSLHHHRLPPARPGLRDEQQPARVAGERGRSEWGHLQQRGNRPAQTIGHGPRRGATGAGSTAGRVAGAGAEARAGLGGERRSGKRVGQLVSYSVGSGVGMAVLQGHPARPTGASDRRAATRRTHGHLSRSHGACAHRHPGHPHWAPKAGSPKREANSRA